MRIVILGCAGSGKTTLARRLAQLTGAPVICLDDIWQAHWRDADVPAFRELMKQMHAGDAWISDGNFADATFDIRLPSATLILWLERSRVFCIWHAVARLLKRGEGHKVRKLFTVVAFIWNFDRVNRPRIEDARTSYGANVQLCRLTNDQEIERFMSAYVDGAR